MTEVKSTAATLRFFGHDLNPDEITRLLCKAPTVGVRRGETFRNSGGRGSVSPRGVWRLRVERVTPGDLDIQIKALLEGTTPNLEIWQQLTSRYKADVFCGLFLEEAAGQIAISPSILLMLGERGLTLDLDIYSGYGEKAE